MTDYSNISTLNDRTASARGDQYKSVQAWKHRKNPAQTAKIASQTPAQQQILTNLDKAAHGKVGTFDMELETGFSYTAGANSPVTNSAGTAQKEGYQFNDVIDVINPLQHLPVVGTIYRELTGDKIHPVSQIIGGALYGGPVGAVGGTINAISQVQNGKDLGGYALGLVGIGANDALPANPAIDPLQQLNAVANKLEHNAPLEQLPGSTLAFVNLSEPADIIKREIAEGRTAGSMFVKKQKSVYSQPIISSFAPMPQDMPPQKINLESLSPRENITSVSLSPMPPRQDT